MNIVGLDELVFAVDDVEGCTQYLLDYGLSATQIGPQGGRFEALDGTAIVIHGAADPGRAPSIHETVYGVSDPATLERIDAELRRDREVRRAADGSLHTVDDMGFALGFQLTRRRPFNAPPALSNAPGHPPQRMPNQPGADPGAVIMPLTLSHVVYFVPDTAKAEAFYTQRLRFVTTDRFTGVGPFLRPAGTLEHHTLFMIQAPPFMQGVEHFTFHLGSGSEVLQAGTRFAAKGYQSFWGARAAPVGFELVLVLQQPVRVPCRVRRRHGFT
jgi:catechol 2,3-dioxygenase-like lactoylglutathione lyase family enzyme